MTHPNNSPDFHKPVKGRKHKFLAGAGATVASLTLMAAQPRPAAAEHLTGEEAGYIEGQPKPPRPGEFHSPNPAIPESVAKIMSHETVFFPAGGCSGEIIRNVHGEVVGALAAAHCKTITPIEGSDGQLYYDTSANPDLIQTGDRKDNLRTIAAIDSYILPGKGDQSHDLAFAVAKGHTPAEVLAAYRESALTIAEIHKLKEGETAYLSGWPAYQPGSRLVEQRQSFALKIIGLGRTMAEKGKIVPVVWAEVPANQNGAECSWGDSGGEGFVIRDGKKYSIGTLSAFIDLGSSGITGTGVSGGPPIKQPRGNAVAICGFSYEVPTPDNVTIVHNVTNAAEIPGYWGPDVAFDEARREFSDPAIPKLVVDGTIELNSGKGPVQFAKRPMIFHNEEHHVTVIAWASGSEHDKHLLFNYYSDDELYKMSIYANEETNMPHTFNTGGPLAYQVDISGQTGGEFIDANGQIIGEEYLNPPSLIGQAYGLTFINGQPSIALKMK